MYFQKFTRVKGVHEEGDICMQKWCWISDTTDVTDAFLLLCFQYLTHRLNIVVVKSSPVCLD